MPRPRTRSGRWRLDLLLRCMRARSRTDGPERPQRRDPVRHSSVTCPRGWSLTLVTGGSRSSTGSRANVPWREELALRTNTAAKRRPRRRRRYAIREAAPLEHAEELVADVAHQLVRQLVSHLIASIGSNTAPGGSRRAPLSRRGVQRRLPRGRHHRASSSAPARRRIHVANSDRIDAGIASKRS